MINKGPNKSIINKTKKQKKTAKTEKTNLSEQVVSRSSKRLDMNNIVGKLPKYVHYCVPYNTDKNG